MATIFIAYLAAILATVYVVGRLFGADSRNVVHQPEPAYELEHIQNQLTSIHKSRADNIEGRIRLLQKYAAIKRSLNTSRQYPALGEQAADVIEQDTILVETGATLLEQRDTILVESGGDLIRQDTAYIRQTAAFTQHIANNTQLIADHPVQFELLLASLEEELGLMISPSTSTELAMPTLVEDYQAAMAESGAVPPEVVGEYSAAVMELEAAVAELHAAIASIKPCSTNCARCRAAGDAMWKGPWQ